MNIDEKYMWRCLYLASKGGGNVKPNPKVGAVIVEGGEIIGEGYHRQFGESHAEVNAVASVSDLERLKSSTMYVSLEPCAHYGKTPPCAHLIVRSGIPKVVVAIADPNPAVSGKGIKILRDAGIEVEVGVLEEEASELNKMFLVNQIHKRPFVILKWAQSRDGYVDIKRKDGDSKEAVVFSNNLSSVFVHKIRTEVQGIMVGTNTALLDNPSLTARHWNGGNPVRIVLDRYGRLPSNLELFDGVYDTIVFTQEENNALYGKVKQAVINFKSDVIGQILSYLYDDKIYSIIVEGGTSLLNSFVDMGLWDEAYVEVAPFDISDGIKAPELNLTGSKDIWFEDNVIHHVKNKITQNII